jgi:hypothetical protein
MEQQGWTAEVLRVRIGEWAAPVEGLGRPELVEQLIEAARVRARLEAEARRRRGQG